MMDHSEALESQACEKYLLGELSLDLRDAYEEHYFSCPVCAAELRSTAELLGIARDSYAQSPVAVVQPEPAPASAGWFAWLKPAFALPALAALLGVIGYQNFATIPQYKRSSAPRVLPMYSLITANTRAEGGLVFRVPPDQLFGLYLDIPADPAFSTYLLRLETPSGSTAPLPSLTADQAQKTQVITVDPGRETGKYVIVVSGLASSSADAFAAKELARFPFTVELKN